FEVHVSAALDPFVVLLGQDRPDQADEGVTVGEDPDHVGTSADLSVQPLGGVVGPDLTPGLLRERGECKYLLPSALQVLSRSGELLPQSVEHAVELGVNF